MVWAWLAGILVIVGYFAGSWFLSWCHGTTPQWEGTYVVGWMPPRPGLGLGGRHAITPRNP